MLTALDGTGGGQGLGAASLRRSVVSPCVFRSALLQLAGVGAALLPLHTHYIGGRGLPFVLCGAKSHWTARRRASLNQRKRRYRCLWSAC